MVLNFNSIGSRVSEPQVFILLSIDLRYRPYIISVRTNVPQCDTFVGNSRILTNFKVDMK